MAFSSLNSFSASTGLGVSSKKTTTTTYSSGLYYKGYTNNTTSNSYPYNWDQNKSYANSVSFFNNNTAAYTGTTNQINANYSSFVGNSTSNTAISFYGYFKPNVTGIWTFLFGNTTLPPDDLATFWIGTAGQTTTSLRASATNSNYQKGSNYQTSGITNWAYTTPSSLTSGLYYPIMMNWGQNTGGQQLYLQFAQVSTATTGTAWINNGSGYYYNTGA